MADRSFLASEGDPTPPPQWTFRPAGARASLLFAGDLALHRWQADDSLERVFGGAQDVFRSVDFRVVNLESVLTDRTDASGSIGRFIRAAPATVRCLQRLGVDAVCAANNHALDFGSAGLAESRATLQDAGIPSCGLDADGASAVSGATVHVVNGVRIGMLAATDHFGGTREPRALSPVWLNTASMREAVRGLKASCDVVVVQLHWGYEYVMYPLRWHRDFARQLVDDGADIVCCHHAHVVMGAERHAQGIIAHGLGNFWFGQLGEVHPAFRSGVLLRASIDRHGVVDAAVVPVYTDTSLALRVADHCVSGFDRLCAALRSDRTVSAVEASRVSVEIASMLRDVTTRLAQHDVAGLLERQQYLSAPRHDWLLDHVCATGSREWRAVAEWLRYFRSASRDVVERQALTAPPVVRGAAQRADNRRLRGRLP
jgi:poly-gamma-glutamate synthesis protein (capsule biosynthesis protein)